jgi:hypothetical protein
MDWEYFDEFLGGIGPTDQLQVVQTSTDGPTMINSTYWINTPVGYNLDDHLNVCSCPKVSYRMLIEIDGYGYLASKHQLLRLGSSLGYTNRYGRFKLSE